MRPFAAVFLPLLLAYATALGWCVARWNSPTAYFEHCWLLPPLAALLLWLRRGEWSRAAAVPDPRGFWLLGPALALHLYGAALTIDSASAASLVLAVPGAAWVALGRQRLRGLWPILMLTVFAVPAPIYVEGRLAFVLKEFAVEQGSWLGNLLGAGVVRDGAHLHLQGRNEGLFVADACGGLRSLLAMATLAYCLAFFLGPPRPLRRIGLLLAAVPIAVSANVVRIAILCVLARRYGVPFAEGTGHTLANVGEWLADLGLLVLVDRVLHLWRGGIRPAAPASPGAAAPAPAGSLRGPAWTLWALAVPLLFLCLYRPAGGARDRAERLPEAVAGWQLVPRTPAQQQEFATALPRWVELLGTPDFVWRRYRDGQGRRIQLVALFHDTNWKSVHPPRICIEGSNMDIEVDDLVVVAGPQPGLQCSRIVAKARGNGTRFLTLSVFGTRDWSSGSYESFWWHHMPKALLRDNDSGFLLRVETPIDRGESDAVAQQRCASFLQALLPAAREQLR